VLYEGRIVRELGGNELTEQKILTAAFNVPENEVTVGEAAH
jgi:hypothetical protein